MINKLCILTVTAVLLIGLAAWWYLSRPGPTPRPHIILIVADTLRADHMGCYGYPRNTTPNIDRFSRDCLICDRAYSPIPFTPSAHMSIFTSLNVAAHGFYNSNSHPLSPLIATLPEKLEKAGYYTAGIVSSLFLKGEFGFSRGFNSYLRIDDRLTMAQRITREAEKWLNRTKDYPNKRLFLFLHYYDPHSDFYNEKYNRMPYYAPKEFIDKFCADPELSLAYQKQVGSYATQYLLDLDENGIIVDEPVRNSIIDLYDAGIAFFDSQIGQLLVSLQEKGLYNESLILLTSDHGEEFQEHGQFIHNQTYEENIRVPVLIKFPKKSDISGRVEVPVGLIDIMPTILNYLRIPAKNSFQGVSLLPSAQSRSGKEREIFSRQKNFQKGDIYSLTGRQYKLIYNITNGEKELYDLMEDPGENNNIAGYFPEITGKFSRKIKSIIASNREFANGIPENADLEKLSPDEIKKLEALGYSN